MIEVDRSTHHMQKIKVSTRLYKSLWLRELMQKRKIGTDSVDFTHLAILTTLIRGRDRKGEGRTCDWPSG